MSPILPTLSHPEAPGIGWNALKTSITNIEIPVFALGGMQPEDLSMALASGARGIAMQRAYWS